jgi:hypothetical protein
MKRIKIVKFPKKSNKNDSLNDFNTYICIHCRPATKYLKQRMSNYLLLTNEGNLMHLATEHKKYLLK